jgi:hypothetical protein
MKTNQFSKLSLIAVIAVFLTLSSMNTTPMQPVYSQATHCGEGNLDEDNTFKRCVTPGDDPVETLEICNEEGCSEIEEEMENREAGRVIGEMHHSCSNDPREGSSKLDPDQCSVNPPDNDDD